MSEFDIFTKNQKVNLEEIRNIFRIMIGKEISKKYGENFGWYSHMIDHCETALEGIKRTGTLEAFIEDKLIFDWKRKEF